MGQNKKNIMIISGNGKDLDISSVSSHVPPTKPRINKNTKKIVIPNEKTEKK